MAHVTAPPAPGTGTDFLPFAGWEDLLTSLALLAAVAVVVLVIAAARPARDERSEWQAWLAARSRGAADPLVGSDPDD